MAELPQISSDELICGLMSGRALQSTVVNGDVYIGYDDPSSLRFPLITFVGSQLCNVTFNGHLFISFALFYGDFTFLGCNFNQGVTLADCHFSGNVSFPHSIFHSGAWFPKCSFHGKADFSRVFIKGPAYFWRSRFFREAIFDEMVVQSLCTDGFGSVDPSEVNFSWAHFSSKASFSRTRINGPACFWRTLFFSDVTIDQTLFGGPTRFMGRESEVSIDLLELGALFGSPKELYDQLKDAELINEDTEEPGGGDRSWYRFAQLKVRSQRELEQQLQAKEISAPLSSRLLEIYDKFARPMFSPSHTAIISGIDVAPCTTFTFVDIDMSHCLLLGFPMDRVELCNVRWREIEMPFDFTIRYASAAEPNDEPKSQQKKEKLHNSAAENHEPDTNLAVLGRMYRELATAYERNHESMEASRFRISQREMARLRLSGWPRFFATVYRYLAVYGESPFVATIWLMVFVLLLFPILYMIGDLFYHAGGTGFGGAVVRRLEVTTFLNSKQGNWSAPTRFIAGTERIVVATQVTVFLLTMKRLLPP